VHFSLEGHRQWQRDDEVYFHGNHSWASPVLSWMQYAMTSIDLYFETDVFMTLSTKVSLDSITQGMIFMLDEYLMKTYYGIEDWQQDTFWIPKGLHRLQWSTSRSYQNPAPFYDNQCWIDMMEFHQVTTIIKPDNSFEDELFTCYPNPSGAVFYGRFFKDPGKIYHAGLYDNSGKLVKLLETAKLGKRGIFWDGRLSAGMNAPNGIYFLKLVTEKGISTIKLIKR
jgi:hypothetical protein